MVNQTINATLNATPELTDLVANSTVVQRLVELIKAPLLHKDMIWIVIPLVFGLILMQIYFGRYKKEELGWNTAVGNSMALLFVTMDLARHVYEASAFNSIPDLIFSNFNKIMVLLVLGMVSFWLLFGEFFHLLPKKLAFWVSSSLPTTLLAYMAIVLIYADVALDLTTLWAGILLFIILSLIFGLIHLLEPISITE